MRSLVIGLALFATSACDSPRELELSVSAVIDDAVLDLSTVLGDAFVNNAMVLGWLEFLECSQTNPVVVHVGARTQGSTGFGRVTLLFGLLEDGEPCDGDGMLSTQPVSIGADGRYLVQGPASIEGQNVEGHIQLGGLPGTLGIFPRWWTIAMTGGETAIPNGTTLRELREGELNTVWSPRQVHAVVNPDTRTFLDVAVESRRQPDVDVDFDGLETFEDDDGDGRWDSCTDGDRETRATGMDCLDGIRFADGYQLRMHMRLIEATLLDAPPLN